MNKPCGCSMEQDGIDTDVLKHLPVKLIRKISHDCNLPSDSYNEALKYAMKAKAKVNNMRLRDYLMSIPDVETAIIKVESMKKGGNLYDPYPKKSQGPYGPKFIDGKTTLSNYAEQQEAIRKKQYRSDLLRPSHQAGGSILNDIGKEHVIIPRNEGNELDITKYIQAYLRSTTNMGKYQDGGALGGLVQSMGGMEGIGSIAQQIGGAFAQQQPTEQEDTGNPMGFEPKRFEEGGVSEAMKFYIDRYPGYKKAIYKNK